MPRERAESAAAALLMLIEGATLMAQMGQGDTAIRDARKAAPGIIACRQRCNERDGHRARAVCRDSACDLERLPAHRRRQAVDGHRHELFQHGRRAFPWRSSSPSGVLGLALSRALCRASRSATACFWLPPTDMASWGRSIRSFAAACRCW